MCKPHLAVFRTCVIFADPLLWVESLTLAEMAFTNGPFGR